MVDVLRTYGGLVFMLTKLFSMLLMPFRFKRHELIVYCDYEDQFCKDTAQCEHETKISYI